MNRKLIASALIAAILPAAAAADEHVEDVLVTGTYAPQPALTAAVSVLDEAQIAALNKRSVADLLQTLPGLLVEQQGGPGGLTAVSVRGGEANFTLVLLDGVPVNDPTNTRGGGFDFANLDSALVERVEVVRGAQSAIYGSDALAGVINIITRRPSQGHQQSLRAEAGEDDFYRVGFTAQGATQALDYTLELATRDNGDPVPGSQRDSDSVNLRLGWSPRAGHRIALAWRYLDGERESYPEQSGGPRLAQLDDLDQADYNDTVLSAAWDWDIADAWRSRLAASRFEHDEDYTSPGIPPYFEVPPNGADTQFTRDQLQWVNTLELAANYRLNLGADYRREDGDSDGYVEYFGSNNPTDFDLDRDTVGLFADVTATPLPALLLRGSLRGDDPDGFDRETSWQAGARVDVGAGVALSANLGQAYKLPSFFALGNALVGNPDLQPEQADNWDAGIAWQARAGLRLAATYFHNDFEDLIDFDDATFRNVNRQNVETAGVELEAQWQPLQALDLRAQATYTDIDAKGEDTVFTGRPEWTAGLVARWRFAPAWDAALDYQFSGEQWAASRHTGQEVTTELDSWHRVDAVLHWQLASAVQLQFSADNLLDEDYETAVGFDAPGRALRVGLRYTR
ncbi:MAG: TonB-dependent receptor [Halioglobus sp.]|nr:TonB-dependent receptor [Halioglobus sp.]